MMKWLQNLRNIKTNLDIWFFFLFLLTFTLSVRKVLFYFPIQGTINEYTGTYIYLSDIFLFLAIGSWLILSLCNERCSLSMDRLWITQLLHKLSHLSTMVKPAPYLYTPLILAIWAFLSIFWSDNKVIAIFRSIKLLEYYFLYLYIVLRFIPKLFHPVKCSDVPRGTSEHHGAGVGHFETLRSGIFFTGWNIFFIVVLLVSFIQSAIAIIQVAIQHSIGMLWLKESIISLIIPGVAKIMINGGVYIRAYGLFPHPNILGGFLLFSIILTLLHIKMLQSVKLVIVPRLPHGMFHLPEMQPQLNSKNNGGHNNPAGIPKSSGISLQAGVEHSLRGGTFWNVLIYVLLLIQLSTLLLTASKSAIIGLLIALAYIYVPRGTKVWQNCSTWNNSRIRMVILVILIAVTLIFMFSHDLRANFNQSLQYRIITLIVPRGTIFANPIAGAGMGQFVWNMQKYRPIPLETWQFQPVHNVFLLAWSELGIIGVGLFIYWLYSLFANKCILQNNNNILSIQTSLYYFRGILLGLIFIMLFDHYFWDIQQGSYLLWITAGLIAGIYNLCYNSTISE